MNTMTEYHEFKWYLYVAGCPWDRSPNAICIAKAWQSIWQETCFSDGSQDSHDVFHQQPGLLAGSKHDPYRKCASPSASRILITTFYFNIYIYNVSCIEWSAVRGFGLIALGQPIQTHDNEPTNSFRRYFSCLLTHVPSVLTFIDLWHCFICQWSYDPSVCALSCYWLVG